MEKLSGKGREFLLETLIGDLVSIQHEETLHTGHVVYLNPSKVKLSTSYPLTTKDNFWSRVTIPCKEIQAYQRYARAVDFKPELIEIKKGTGTYNGKSD